MRLDEINKMGYLILGDGISDEIGWDLVRSNEIRDFGPLGAKQGMPPSMQDPFRCALARIQIREVASLPKQDGFESRIPWG